MYYVSTTCIELMVLIPIESPFKNIRIVRFLSEKVTYLGDPTRHARA